MIINIKPFNTYKDCKEYIEKKDNNITIYLISTTGGYIYQEENTYYDLDGAIDNNIINMLKPFLENTKI